MQKPTVDLRIDCNVVSVLDSRGNKVDGEFQFRPTRAQNSLNFALFVAKGLFSGRLNGNQDCELVKSGGLLDRETNEEFTVEMVLNTRSAYADRTKLKTVVSRHSFKKSNRCPRTVSSHMDAHSDNWCIS